MDLEEVRRRFVQEVKLRAYDDQYVDSQEEREILQIAIQIGVSVDSARSALAQVCEREGYILESSVLGEAARLLEQFAANDGRIDEKEFNDTVAICLRACANKRTLTQAKRMVVTIIRDKNYTIKAGWFSNWFTAVKKEVGM